MRKRVLTITAITVALAVLAVGIFTISSPPSAVAMLEQAAERASQVTSFRVQVIATQVEGDEVVNATTTIEAVWPDAFHVRTVASDGTDEEMIQVDGKQYFRAGNEQWQVTDAPSLCERCYLGEEVRGLTRALVNVKIVGEEVVNGKATIHIKGHTDMAAKAAQIWRDYDKAPPEVRQQWELPRQQWLAGEEYVDLWLDRDSKLIVRVRMQDSFPTTGYLEAYSFDVTMVYDFDAEIKIEAPTTAAP